MKNKPAVKRIDLSFVVVEYHCVDDIKKCISSIRHSADGLLHEIIVSSNSPYPVDKRRNLEREMPDVRWVFNAVNRGFAGAVNAGIAHASGSCIVITNADVVFKQGSLASAYRYLTDHRDAGIIGPKIVDREGNIQDCCRRFMTPWRFSVRFAKRLLFRRDVVLRKGFDYGKLQPVDWIVGAFMMVKREAMEKVGLMDEDYFLYVEDMDWCKRFRDLGYSVIYYPGLTVEYKADKKSIMPLVSGGFINEYTLHHVRSYWRFLKKHRMFLGIKK
ncbi:MAG: glycosyltransferase family 2 protein [Nitrospirota bacterium]